MPSPRLASWMTFINDGNLILEQGWNPGAGMVEDTKSLVLDRCEETVINNI